MVASDCQRLCPRSGDWVKGKVIGSGSFGTVHLAMNKATGALFVVKSTESGAGAKVLKNEADILESLNSPQIVRCIGRNLLRGANGDQTLCISMEYMAGGSISDVAEKFGGTLDTEVIRLYTREILKGLKHIHNNGVVHCDLKCNNVLLGSNGEVKLADFGCAMRKVNDLGKKEDLNHCRQSIGGTPLWTAPEVLRNEGVYFASDIWSLGCTVVEMATGRPPWGSTISNPLATVLKIACSNEKPQFPKHFPEDGLDFLAKCLERNPKKRWSAEELLNHPFMSGKSMKNSKEESACSPSSILDFGLYKGENDSDGPDSPDEDGFKWTYPFSRWCDKRNRRETRPEYSEYWSSEDWITVRSS